MLTCRGKVADNALKFTKTAMSVALAQLFAERLIKAKGGFVMSPGLDKVTRHAFDLPEMGMSVGLPEQLAILLVYLEGSVVARPGSSGVTLSEGEFTETEVSVCLTESVAQVRKDGESSFVTCPGWFKIAAVLLYLTESAKGIRFSHRGCRLPGKGYGHARSPRRRLPGHRTVSLCPPGQTVHWLFPTDR